MCSLRKYVYIERVVCSDVKFKKVYNERGVVKCSLRN